MSERLRFPPSRRVKKRAEFLAIQGGNEKFRGRFFLLALQKNEIAVTRLGITVTTKLDKRAVRRNLLKRRIREIFRKGFLNLPVGYNGVVIALNGSMELSYQEIENELCYLVRRAKKHFGQN